MSAALSGDNRAYLVFLEYAGLESKSILVSGETLWVEYTESGRFFGSSRKSVNLPMGREN